MKIFVGWDARDILAYEVCRASIEKYGHEVIPLKSWELNERGLYWRAYHVDRDFQKYDMADGKPFSTDFSFTRFAVPALCEYTHEPVMFCDADMMFRADPATCFEYLEDNAVACVKHNHVPTEDTKALGIQTVYARKNWSSLMVMSPEKCARLTKYQVNTSPGAWLHGLHWADSIAAIPEEWNWLCGYSDEDINPKNVHYTLGTPDMVDELPYADEWWSYAQNTNR